MLHAGPYNDNIGAYLKMDLKNCRCVSESVHLVSLSTVRDSTVSHLTEHAKPTSTLPRNRLKAGSAVCDRFFEKISHSAEPKTGGRLTEPDRNRLGN